MTPTALVLGAGAVGASTALHLQRRSWSVALVDRLPPGRATTYGNAGIIQSEAVEPYAMRRAWPALWGIATGRTNDVRYSIGAPREQAGSLLRYWWHSAPRAATDPSRLPTPHSSAPLRPNTASWSGRSERMP